MHTIEPVYEPARNPILQEGPPLPRLRDEPPSNRRSVLFASMFALYASWLAGTASAAGDPANFNGALADDYKALSQSEYAQGDERDGATYAARAVAAGQGQATTPEDPALREAFLKERYKPDLNTARANLLKSLDAGGRSNAPAAAARAQSSYDCWLEQAAEDIQPAEIEACRQSFMTALAVVDEANGHTVTAHVETPVVEPVAPATPVPQIVNYRVFFGFNRADLGKPALATLAEIKVATDGSHPSHIVVIGHASTIGSEAHNQALSQRRADAVKAELVRLDVHADSIETKAMGEHDLLVPTADGVREPRNRQVYIIIE